MIVILDNRDSFVLNIRHRLIELGVPSLVMPAHATRLDQIEAQSPDGLIVSPGPQGPDEAGISTAAIRSFGRRIPVLGICLGHQCIAVAYGLAVAPNSNACHGRSSQVEHDGKALFEAVPNPFDAGRYHALAAVEPAADSVLQVSARLADGSGLIMGLRHRSLPTEGVQFHPESVLSPQGYRIIGNFAKRCGYPIADALLLRGVAEAECLLRS